MDKFAHWSATELLAAMQARLISSVELLELYIDRYEKVNPAINAIVTTDFDRARERARAADDARAKGRSWGSLHGLPMTIKECIEVAGTACTVRSGTLVLPKMIAPAASKASVTSAFLVET